MKINKALTRDSKRDKRLPKGGINSTKEDEKKRSKHIREQRKTKEKFRESL
jgi:hypothetical protein